MGKIAEFAASKGIHTIDEEDIRNTIRTELKRFTSTIPHPKIRLQRYKPAGHENRTEMDVISDTIRLALQLQFPPDLYTAEMVNSIIKIVITMDESNSKRAVKKRQQKELAELALQEQRYHTASAQSVYHGNQTRQETAAVERSTAKSLYQGAKTVEYTRIIEKELANTQLDIGVNEREAGIIKSKAEIDIISINRETATTTRDAEIIKSKVEHDIRVNERDAGAIKSQVELDIRVNERDAGTIKSKAEIDIISINRDTATTTRDYNSRCCALDELIRLAKLKEAEHLCALAAFNLQERMKSCRIDAGTNSVAAEPDVGGGEGKVGESEAKVGGSEGKVGAVPVNKVPTENESEGRPRPKISTTAMKRSGVSGHPVRPLKAVVELDQPAPPKRHVRFTDVVK